MKTSSYRPKVYLSGGFKSNWQSKVIKEIGDNCLFFNPREHKLESDKEYWIWDIHFVKNCDIVFAYMETDNPSGYGLTLEIGLAYALNKTIILVDEKSKRNLEFEKYFKIVSNSSHIVFDDLERGIEYLKNFTLLKHSII